MEGPGCKVQSPDDDSESSLGRQHPAQELFHRAAALTAEQWPGFLDRACGGNAALRLRVERMLAADGKPNPDWQVSALEAFARRDGGEPEMDYAVRSFGRYRVLKRIGSGGMGVVYKAVREDDQYRQTVAIKILPCGLDTPDSVQRFRHERQVLANLVHPSIARLLDGGATDDGLPYLVMDFVEGLPLDTFVKQTAPSMADRLRLFQRVCDAVQFAHRNLVVHCDIKPANILVESDGTPKLLDFGISQLLDEGHLSRTATAPLMTPEYASPEQVLGKPLTTATDVYSLGVLLNVLLTARRPYQTDGERPVDVTRAVCERGLDTSGLPEDLGNIIAMATRKEPERRYSSAEQLSADVARYVAHRPVLARRDTFLYRARKYARRNALALALVFLAVTAAGSGVTVSLLQSRRAARRFDEIRGLSHYLIFDTYDGMASLPGSTPLRKAVVGQARQYLDRLARDAGDDPSLAADIADSYVRLGMILGYPYIQNLGDTPAALASIEKARAILEPLARKFPRRATIAASLATVYRRRAIILSREDRADESIAAARQAVAILERSKQSAPIDSQRSLELARAQLTAGAVEEWRATEQRRTPGFEAGLLWMRKCIATLEAVPPGAGTESADRVTLIAMVYQNVSDTQRNWGEVTGDPRHYEAALLASGKSLAAWRKLPADDVRVRRDVADCVTSMGRVMGLLGRYADAEQSYQEALPEFERLVAADRDNLEAKQDLANLCNYRGETFARAGRKAEAAHWSNRSIPMYESVLQHDPRNRESAELLEKAKARKVAPAQPAPVKHSIGRQ
ncbi:MAG: serine/threonine protein kinase with repeat [Bryobacterales bacterium]|nr:serine/threonine protein kinase with repeat [Bryobacterales bacterium]